MTRDEIDRLLAFFFRPGGRIGREEFVLGTGFILAIDAAVIVSLSPEEPGAGDRIALFLVFTLPLLVAQFVLAAKRSHDLGLPGSFVLLLVVPVLGLGWMLLLATMRGSPGINSYGAPPEFRPD
jgi:uncharacterized membrane protein YhaH (DUF805 family)